VSLTFDYGHADQYAARSILASHNMKGTFYINSGRIDTTAAFLTRPQLTDLAGDGNEIAGHTVQHADLPTRDPDEAKREICNDRVNLINWGFHPTNFAYPYGHDSPAVEQMASDCGYNSARQIGDIVTPVDDGCPGCAKAESIPPADPFHVRAPDSVDNNWTVADVQQLVTQAETSGGGWVPITFHHICNGCATGYSFSPANLTTFLDWLQARVPNGTVVKTVDQVIGGNEKPAVNGPAAPPGAALQNASLETDANNDGAPDCWSFGTFGTNTAT